MSWSITRAAKETGLSKSTISRAIKSGKISAQKAEDGAYQIEPAELFRVYPKGVAQPSSDARRDAPRNPHEEPDTTPSKADETLRVENEMLREMLDRERETVTDLRKRLDAATDRVLALAQPPQPSSDARHDAVRNPPEPPVERGFWGRLFGRN